MRVQQRRVQVLCAMAVLVVSAFASGQTNTTGQDALIPSTARGLEGLPAVRLDAARGEAKRQELDRGQAVQQALKIDIVNGHFYWTSRDNRPLTLFSAGEFTYLMSKEPGQYVRLRKVKDRIEYVEHVDTDRDFGLNCVTWWGELRILGAR